jgi:hypothetical protein
MSIELEESKDGTTTITATPVKANLENIIGYLKKARVARDRTDISLEDRQKEYNENIKDAFILFQWIIKNKHEER